MKIARGKPHVFRRGWPPHVAAYHFVTLALLWCAASCPIPKRTTGPAEDLQAMSDVVDSHPDMPFDTRQTSDPGERCTPQCYAKVCGEDGCGGVCGECPSDAKCSHDGTICIPKDTQSPLGARCGPNEYCRPYLTWHDGSRYDNPDWPGCADDQCSDGPCVNGFCSKVCALDTPSDCQGTTTSFFPTGFSCIHLAGLPPGEGLCLPTQSGKHCDSHADCPGGEVCVFVGTPSGQPVRLCLTVPQGGVPAGGECSWEMPQSAGQVCEGFSCISGLCSRQCAGDGDCLLETSQCLASGRCANEPGVECQEDTDCSPLRCGDLVSTTFHGQVQGLCVPRECARDQDCGDQRFYCRHSAAGEGEAVGMCARGTPNGAAFGQPCGPIEPGASEIPCFAERYCVLGRCSRLCTGDEDCDQAGIEARCGFWKFQEEGASQSTSVPVCLWDSNEEECTWTKGCTCVSMVAFSSGEAVFRPFCAETGGQTENDVGLPCDEPGLDGTCLSRTCTVTPLAYPLAEGVCTRLCLKAADCPGATYLPAGKASWTCGATWLSSVNTAYLGDDFFAPTCIPVPAESSLQDCSKGQPCPAGEVCRRFFTAVADGKLTGSLLQCVVSQVGGEVGDLCDLRRRGSDCKSGLCVATEFSGVSVCSSVCFTDVDCASPAGLAVRCTPHMLWPGEGDGAPLVGTDCMVGKPCLECVDDRDCAVGQRCVDLAAGSFSGKRRCLPECEQDLDCTEYDAECGELPAIPATSKATTARVCYGGKLLCQ